MDKIESNKGYNKRKEEDKLLEYLLEERNKIQQKIDDITQDNREKKRKNSEEAQSNKEKIIVNEYQLDELIPSKYFRDTYIGIKQTVNGKRFCLFHKDPEGKIVIALDGEWFLSIKEQGCFHDLEDVNKKHKLIYKDQNTTLLQGYTNIPDQGDFYPHTISEAPMWAVRHNDPLPTDRSGEYPLYLVIENGNKKNIAHIPPVSKGEIKDSPGKIISNTWFDEIPTEGFNGRSTQLKLNDSSIPLEYQYPGTLREVTLNGKKYYLNIIAGKLLDTNFTEIKDGKAKETILPKGSRKKLNGNKITLKETDLNNTTLQISLGNSFHLECTLELHPASKKTIGISLRHNGTLLSFIKKGESFIFERATLDPSNTKISRKHAQITFKDSIIEIEDLHSTNHTYVERK